MRETLSTDKFKGKYRISSSRYPGYDYGGNGIYFVTICTQNHEHFFGEITNGKMHHSPIGHITKKYWIKIPIYYPDIRLAEWIIMPNHVHGILIIKANSTDAQPGRLPTPKKKNPHWQPGNLGVIINQYKRACTIASRKINSDFAWQSRFYDRIIRDKYEFHRTCKYIRDNPKNWGRTF